MFSLSRTTFSANFSRDNKIMTTCIKSGNKKS
uniref:Uncharacterized protein n=1 Tax=Anguilla anguilla TaxID=7936 RepID=A0A0E9T7I2_ANGAN